MKKSEVFEKVKETLIECLGIEEGEEIIPDSKLIEDLGAESIDFLDIFSRFERRFDITLDTSGVEVENLIAESVSDEELETGILPPEVLSKLSELMPEIDPSEFKEGLRLNEIPLLFTVDSMMKAIVRALKEQNNIDVVDDMTQ